MKGLKPCVAIEPIERVRRTMLNNERSIAPVIDGLLKYIFLWIELIKLILPVNAKKIAIHMVVINLLSKSFITHVD